MEDEMDEADQRHLRRAIELAAVARRAGDMPFGSLLVDRHGRVLKEELNTVITQRDIAGHPELKLARWAARELDRENARQTTMYTSCEPCPMCRGAIARANLGRVVFALSADQLQDLRPPGQVGPDAVDIEYQGPTLFEEARMPIEGYYG
jgi:tRNA(Arg) A34 adenosine deaminase TadA